MEVYLKQIAENTEPKDSFNILVSANTTDVTTWFNPTLILKPRTKYDVALVYLETFYSFLNIDSTNNIFTYSPGGGQWKTITFPEGCYEIEDINNYISAQMKENNDFDTVNNKAYITITPNFNTLKSVMVVEPGYTVDFTKPNSINTILGFNARAYIVGTHDSENIVNILTVNSIHVTSDLISGSYTNGVRDNVIYSFSPEVPPGFEINEKPAWPVYLPVTKNEIITMQTKLTDQNGKLLNLRGEKVDIRFHLREA